MPQSNCCHKFYFKKVDIEQKRRKVCKKCGFIDYKNPKIVTGSLVIKNKKYYYVKGRYLLVMENGLFLQAIWIRAKHQRKEQ